jgi:hypothetical protein
LRSSFFSVAAVAWGLRFCLGHVAAVEEFALQKSYANTRMVFVELFSPRRALLQIFHHKHVQPPLAGLVGYPLCATTVGGDGLVRAAETEAAQASRFNGG